MYIFTLVLFAIPHKTFSVRAWWEVQRHLHDWFTVNVKVIWEISDTPNHSGERHSTSASNISA